MRRTVEVLCLVLLATGCGAEDPSSSSDDEELHAPAGVYVNGVYHDVETDYLPHVVQCENGGAPLESLKAQAVAARTFLLSATRGQPTPHIGDGQQYQVYGCGVSPSAAARAAVQATAGVFLTYGGQVANGQFVAGALTNTVCAPTYDPTRTERYVTRNEGRTGSAVQPAPAPLGNPTSPLNRGCMGQNLANCLASQRAYDWHAILRYFYGADIVESGGTPAPTGARCPGYGDFCGADGVQGGDANTLYHCTGAGRVPTSSTPCASCTVEPAGVGDRCAAGPKVTCPGYGDFCGTDGVQGGSANVLYHCASAGQPATSSTPCARGCSTQPTGVSDRCF